MPRKSSLLLIAAVLLCSALLVSSANASIVQIADQNAVARLQYHVTAGDTDPNGDSVQNGMYRWTVDGVDQMQQQWFWVRVGSATKETPLDQIMAGTPTLTTLDTNGNGVKDYVRMQYTGSSGGQSFTIATAYTLRGGTTGSKTSDMTEQITLKNTSTKALTFNFFQYSNFDLGNTALGDTLSITGKNTATQKGDGTTIAETVVLPNATHYWGADPTTILASLNNTSATTLPDTVDTFNGNQAWAFQWTFTLNAGASLIITKDKLISPIPEPSTLMLLGWGGLLLLRPVRNRIRRVAA